MSGPFASLTPRRLAEVWATALTQLVDLAQAGVIAAIEVLSDEKPVPAEECAEIMVPRAAGTERRLAADELVGETFGATLHGGLVTFSPAAAVAPGADAARITCCVSLPAGHELRGDIYRGKVRDEHGVPVADLVLEAGS